MFVKLNDPAYKKSVKFFLITTCWLIFHLKAVTYCLLEFNLVQNL
uniref:Uncharacterized protein n=1 Tax=Rhizophora mucronata TaxID=61149 RepID=A0A2P2QSC1_RHIMU